MVDAVVICSYFLFDAYDGLAYWFWVLESFSRVFELDLETSP